MATRRKVVLTVPGELGLSKSQIASLKKNFKSQLVHSLGKQTAGAITIVVVIQIVF